MKKQFEAGQEYTGSLTNGYESAFKCIARTHETVVFESSNGDPKRSKIKDISNDYEVTKNNGFYITAE